MLFEGVEFAVRVLEPNSVAGLCEWVALSANDLPLFYDESVIWFFAVCSAR